MQFILIKGKPEIGLPFILLNYFWKLPQSVHSTVSALAELLITLILSNVQ